MKWGRRRRQEILDRRNLELKLITGSIGEAIRSLARTEHTIHHKTDPEIPPQSGRIWAIDYTDGGRRVCGHQFVISSGARMITADVPRFTPAGHVEYDQVEIEFDRYW